MSETFFVSHTRVAVLCGHFAHAQCLVVTFHKQHVSVIAIIIPRLRACGMPAVTMKNILLHMWTSTPSPSTPCDIYTRQFSAHCEEIHYFTEMFPVKIETLRLIPLNRSGRDIHMEIFDYKEPINAVHSALREKDMMEDM